MLRSLIILLVALSSVSAAFLAPPTQPVLSMMAASRVVNVEMGRGDKRTAKGKRKAKSHGAPAHIRQVSRGILRLMGR